jgi:putative transposase
MFCPKFRHKIIKGLVEDVVKQLIQEICNTYGYTLIQMEVMPDHLHIFLSAPPTVAPTAIVTKLKASPPTRYLPPFRISRKAISGAVDYGAGVTISVLPETSAPLPSVNISKPRNPSGRR